MHKEMHEDNSVRYLVVETTHDENDIPACTEGGFVPLLLSDALKYLVRGWT